LEKSLNIVSVSLGSSTRDKKFTACEGDIEVTVERRGTDGDMEKAIELIRELDGKVDAIGLGGIDLYLIANNKKYVIHDAKKMADAAKTTPVVDGSGLKNTLERYALNYIAQNNIIDFKGKKVLLVSGLDRFGMAELLPELGADVTYGDAMFALGLPLKVKRLSSLKLLAATLLPIVGRLPFRIIYPTGSKQEKQSRRQNDYNKVFAENEIIAGDFHYINRYMPSDMTGKIIITNTTTSTDIENLFSKGVKMIISTTPNFDGRSFGTNLCEGIIIALSGKSPEEIKPEDYEYYIKKLNWLPNVIKKDGDN